MKHPTNKAERIRLKKLRDAKEILSKESSFPSREATANRVWRKRTREQVKEKEAHDQLIRAAQLRAEDQFE